MFVKKLFFITLLSVLDSIRFSRLVTKIPTGDQNFSAQYSVFELVTKIPLVTKFQKISDQSFKKDWWPKFRYPTSLTHFLYNFTQITIILPRVVPRTFGGGYVGVRGFPIVSGRGSGRGESWKYRSGTGSGVTTLLCIIFKIREIKLVYFSLNLTD